MKMKIILVFTSVIFSLSCEKPKDSQQLKVPNKGMYLGKIQKLLANNKARNIKSDEGLPGTNSDNNSLVFSPEDFDYSTTEYGDFAAHEPVDHFYVTSFHTSSTFEGGLLSVAYEDNHLINIVNVVENIDTETILSNLYSLDGTRLGSITMRNGRVIETDIMSEDEALVLAPEIEHLRTWWACTRECISDAHIACYLDSHCQRMLLISNLGKGKVIPGQGSLSISVACGATCAYNRDLDLLPQY